MNSILPSIMQSIKPQYCELIAAGKKTIEIRKTKPKIELPAKIHIYQTYHKWVYDIVPQLLNNQKKVIGEYICDEIKEWVFDNETNSYNISDDDLALTCLTQEQLWEYGKGKTLYGYHISELKIYDEPKELSEFRKPCKCINQHESEIYCDCLNCDDAEIVSEYDIIFCNRVLTRPPQSWCYCEEAS